MTKTPCSQNTQRLESGWLARCGMMPGSYAISVLKIEPGL